jgi:ankyrin repeat protein
MAYAARGGHLAVCKTLLEYGADPQINVRWSGAKTLLLAAEEGHLPVVKFLAGLGRDDDNGYKKNAFGCLCYAAKNGHFEVVQYLLETGVRIDQRYSDENALEFASRSGHIEIVKLLLSSCETAKPQIQKFLLRALLAAADKDHRALSDLLRSHLDTQSLIVNTGSKSPLIKKLFSIAAMCGWEDLMQLLLELGCSPDMILERKSPGIENYGWTALAIASKRGHLDLVELLLKYKADVNLAAIHSSPGLPFSSGSRDFPIVLAATHDHIQIVEKLLQHGVNPNPGMNRKRMSFAYNNVRSPEIMHLLLDWGADASIKLKRGHSILSDTLKSGSVAMVKMLLARKIPLEMPPEYIPDGNLRNQRPSEMTQTARLVQRDTLFTLAAQNGAPMVEFLFKEGYQVEPGSNEVSMGFDSALSRADVPLVNLFLERKLLGDLVKSPYENLLGSIMTARSDIEAAATIMDTLLAHGFEIRNDLHLSRPKSAYANSDRNAIYQMLLDRGADPVAGSGPETELSVAARNGDKRGVWMMLKSLDQSGRAPEGLQMKLAFAEEQAQLGSEESLIEKADHPYVKRALHRAFWRSIYL